MQQILRNVRTPNFRDCPVAKFLGTGPFIYYISKEVEVRKFAIFHFSVLFYADIRRWLGGPKKGPKNADVIYLWSLTRINK